MKKLLLVLLALPLIGFGQTAKEYFNKALDYAENEQYQLAIDNYTKCLRLEPDDANKATAYYNRGNAYDELENYTAAIADYNSAIRINPDDADAYYNRGLTYAKGLENYTAAIADFTSAIRIDPDYASAYKNRGLAKENAGQSYCSDYKRACDLGKEECCEWYNDQCK
jgi:tetratricopeptide (TPR) repeat protein